jgi:hypothetical protein
MVEGSLKKKVIAAVAGVVALASAYYAGLKQRPAFNELPPKAQQVIIEEHNALESLLEGATKDFKNGNLDEAVKKYVAAEKIAATIAKSDPKYRELFGIIDGYSQLVYQLSGARDLIEREKGYATQLSIDKIAERVMINPTYRGVPFYHIVGLTSGPYHENVRSAAKAAYLLLLNDWLSVLQGVGKRIEKASGEGLNGKITDAKRMIEGEISYVRDVIEAVEKKP